MPLIASLGSSGSATVAGANFTLRGNAGTLAYDTPVLGVMQSSGAAATQLVHSAGLLGILPAAGAHFELGIRQ